MVGTLEHTGVTSYMFHHIFIIFHHFSSYFHHFSSYFIIFHHVSSLLYVFEQSDGSSDVHQAVRAIAWSPDGEEVCRLSSQMEVFHGTASHPSHGLKPH